MPSYIVPVLFRVAGTEDPRETYQAFLQKLSRWEAGGAGEDPYPLTMSIEQAILPDPGTSPGLLTVQVIADGEELQPLR